MARGALPLVLAATALGGAAKALSSRGAAQADPCACKNWVYVYGRTDVRCGQTNEFFFATGRSHLDAHEIGHYGRDLGGEFCENFYETINDNYCINMHMGEGFPQWCYVDAACPDLGGGSPVSEKLSWKVCAPQKDRLLRTFSPTGLYKLAGVQELDIGLLNKMSYPLSKYMWQDVATFWGSSVDDLAELPPSFANVTLDEVKKTLRQRWGRPTRRQSVKVQRELQQIVDSGEAYTFDTSEDHHPPHVIVQGRTVYAVVRHEPASVLVCVTGCKK